VTLFLRSLRRYSPFALVAAGIVELVLHFYFAQRHPRFEDYQVLASIDFDADALVVAPRWAEPMVRRALGHELPMRAVAAPDLTAASRAMAIEVAGHRADELAAWRERRRERRGAFTVRWLERPGAARTSLDFVDALGPSAEVWLSGPPQTRCFWREDAPALTGGLGGHVAFGRRRFVCPGSPLLNVGVTVIADQDFRPRRCLWAHPPAHGALVVRFPHARLAERIVGHSGMYWMIERERSGAPVELAVAVDGQQIGRIVHRDGDGWAPFELPLGEHANQSGSVSFTVSSDDWSARHFCFEARSIEHGS
jgi:hypothetical protein